MKISTLVVGACVGLASYATHAQPKVEPAQFHHVHLNVTNPSKTIAFYSKNLGAVEVNYRGKSKALFSERSFFLLNKVDEAPAWGPKTALSHIGWSTTDGPATFEFLRKQKVEFETEIESLGANQGMYYYGPDKELIESWTGSRNHRFEHLHFWANDAEVTGAWFNDHLGVPGRVGPKPTLKDPENIAAIRMGFLQAQNVNLIIFERPDFESRWWPGGSYKTEDGPGPEFEPTKGSAIDHLAFSYRDIKPVYDRMKAAGVEIVEEIKVSEEYGHTSFFVMAPDNLLIEVVQDKPIPDGIWED
jgi:catechol 2,3-dioxygenase-like lactoylglutathione lyase family enzyme